MADDLNMDERDPNDLNSHIRVGFHDIFGEPDGAHSSDCAWKCGHTTFTCAKNFCYMVLTTLCSWLFGLCWGCEFACITFVHIWSVTPGLRACIINLGCVQKFCGACYSCFLTPLCESCGMFFSRISVTNVAG